MTRAMNNITYIIKAIMALAVCLAISSCQKTEEPEPEVRDRVLLYYAAGFNDLSYALEKDIKELCSIGYIPEKTSGNVLLVFQNLANGSYTTAVTPTLFRIYRDSNNHIVKEAILTLEAGTLAASVNTIYRILSFVNTTWPSNSYGMIFSSHATGWLPADVKDEPDYSQNSVSPYSIGNEYCPETGVKYEMDLSDFADAIPMHLDYILFDACLMGGVEVAYELKDVCSQIAFSQDEVFADGFDYTTMASYLLASSGAPDLKGVCQAYFEHYNNLTGLNQSATVSLVNSKGMENLAHVCHKLYSTHRDNLNRINPNTLQSFGKNSGNVYFYDLGDIIKQLNLSDQELKEFESALNNCILYKAHTDNFIGMPITAFCGLSSYCTNKFTYDDFYKTLAWNQATCMIE